MSAPSFETESYDHLLKPADLTTWKPLWYFNYYRIALGCIFVLMTLYGNELKLRADAGISILFTVSLFYLLVGIIAVFSVLKRWPDFTGQVYTLTVIDILFITFIMHAAGGAESGWGVLLVVAMAGSSLIMSMQAVLFFASFASLIVLGEQFYTQILTSQPSTSLAQSGMLALVILVVSLASHLLANKLRESEALAAERGSDLANMVQLTQYVIQQMQTGIVVLNRLDQVHLVNESARHQLGLKGDVEGTLLAAVCPALSFRLNAWKTDEIDTESTFRANEMSIDLLPHFARLGADQQISGTLVFLEDMAAMAQQAQQLKLASLGQLTASIAHEIRNPLGAISHAGQLLAEAPDLSKSDLRLTEIIRNHALRVNTIVENILQLSRSGQSRPVQIDLQTWLVQFMEEFCLAQHLDPLQDIVTIFEADPVDVYFDSTQLYQVVWNICHNGLRYTQPSEGAAKLELRVGFTEELYTPYLDLIDFGSGVNSEEIERIFEPFFTKEVEGTGLGLYIARGLCEANQARLNYLPASGGGSCFRITFADIRRTLKKG